MITISSNWQNKLGEMAKILLVVLVSKMKMETYFLQMLVKDKHDRIIMKIIWMLNSLGQRITYHLFCSWASSIDSKKRRNWEIVQAIESTTNDNSPGPSGISGMLKLSLETNREAITLKKEFHQCSFSYIINLFKGKGTDLPRKTIEDQN